MGGNGESRGYRCGARGAARIRRDFPSQSPVARRSEQDDFYATRLICTEPSPTPGSAAPPTERVMPHIGLPTKSDETAPTTIIATNAQTTTTAVYAPALAGGQRISTGSPV